MQWNNWKQGKRCRLCAKNAPIEFSAIKQAFEAEGYNLLAEEWKGNSVKMPFVCPEGHKHHISWAKFNGGKRCLYCSSKAPVTFEHIQDVFTSRGFELLTKKGDYHGVFTMMQYRCPIGHKHQISAKKFRDGDGCPHCAGNARYTIEDARKAFREYGLELLDNTYKGALTPMTVRCSKGHVTTAKTLGSFLNSPSNCGICCPGGFDNNKPGTLYYIKFYQNEKIYYKIGITNNTVSQRFKTERVPFEVISEKQYLFGYMAKEEERRILEKYDKFRYKGEPFLISGNTELFTLDVLKLDTA
jgi:hypothetical protein